MYSDDKSFLLAKGIRRFGYVVLLRPDYRKELGMNIEEKKVREFFDEIANKGVFNSMVWIGCGFCVCFLVMLCFAPVQDMWIAYLDADEGSIMLMLILIIIGPSAAWLRIQPYTLYNENQRNRKVSELLQYHPIDPKEVKKLRIFYMARFMAKVAAVCMLVQIPITLGEYEMLSWTNFVYIVVVAFLWPVGFNVVSIVLKK